MRKIDENKKIELEKIQNRTKQELERLDKEYALFDKVGKSFTYVAAAVIAGFYILIFSWDSFKCFAFIRSGCVFELPKKKSKKKPNKKQNKKVKNIPKNKVNVLEKRTTKSNNMFHNNLNLKQASKRQSLLKGKELKTTRNVKIENEKVKRENPKSNQKLFEHMEIHQAKIHATNSKKDNSLKIIDFK